MEITGLVDEHASRLTTSVPALNTFVRTHFIETLQPLSDAMILLRDFTHSSLIDIAEELDPQDCAQALASGRRDQIIDLMEQALAVAQSSYGSRFVLGPRNSLRLLEVLDMASSAAKAALSLIGDIKAAAKAQEVPVQTGLDEVRQDGRWFRIYINGTDTGKYFSTHAAAEARLRQLCATPQPIQARHVEPIPRSIPPSERRVRELLEEGQTHQLYIAPFRLMIVGTISEHMRSEIERFSQDLKRAFPTLWEALAKRKVPVFVESRTRTGSHGHFSSHPEENHIVLASRVMESGTARAKEGIPKGSYAGDIPDVYSVLGHELTHYIWFTILSSQARDTWADFFHQEEEITFDAQTIRLLREYAVGKLDSERINIEMAVNSIRLPRKKSLQLYAALVAARKQLGQDFNPRYWSEVLALMEKAPVPSLAHPISIYTVIVDIEDAPTSFIPDLAASEAFSEAVRSYIAFKGKYLDNETVSLLEKLLRYGRTNPRLPINRKKV